MNKTSKIMAGAVAASVAVTLAACTPAPVYQCNPQTGQYCNTAQYQNTSVMPIFIYGGGYYYPGYPMYMYHGTPAGYHGPVTPTAQHPSGAQYRPVPTGRAPGSYARTVVPGSYRAAAGIPSYGAARAASISARASVGGFGHGGVSGG